MDPSQKTSFITTALVLIFCIKLGLWEEEDADKITAEENAKEQSAKKELVDFLPRHLEKETGKKRTFQKMLRKL